MRPARVRTRSRPLPRMPGKESGHAIAVHATPPAHYPSSPRHDAEWLLVRALIRGVLRWGHRLHLGRGHRDRLMYSRRPGHVRLSGCGVLVPVRRVDAGGLSEPAAAGSPGTAGPHRGDELRWFVPT